MLFLIYAVPAVVFLSIATAPFQVADELNHVLRADQIGRGKLVSDRLGAPSMAAGSRSAPSTTTCGSTPR